MANNVTTSIVVQFSSSGSASASSLSAELDSRPDGLNQGKTSFLPGDTAAFLVFKGPAVILDSVLASGGAVGLIGEGLFEVEEWLTFANAKEANTAKQVFSDFQYQWFGNNLGLVTYDGSVVTAENSGIGMLYVTYKAQYVAYRISSPSLMNGKTSFQIVVVVSGHD